MIDKASILITSLGRTGTQFLARLFADVLPRSTSLHEPDIFQGTGVDNRLTQYLVQLRQAGPWRMGCLKALGQWTLVKVSDGRFVGRLDPAQAARRLCSQRSGFIRDMPGMVYVEANVGYYGLLDVTPQVFRQHRAAYFVRDGREWIRSHMAWGELYGKSGLRWLVSHKWPGAADFANDPQAEEWRRLSRFEKLCWAWVHLNEYGLTRASQNPNARVFRFEHVFSAKSRYDGLDQLVDFVTSQPGVDRARAFSTNGWLERRVHQSRPDFPSFSAWSRAQQRYFELSCGSLMERLGYET